MFLKVLLVALLILIIISLFTGLGFMLKDNGKSKRTVNALTVRIVLSIIAIVIVIVAGATGVLQVNPSPLQ